MKHILIFLMAGTLITGCAVKKPEPTPTQIVNGKSIVIPPEFDKVPNLPASDLTKGETK